MNETIFHPLRQIETSKTEHVEFPMRLFQMKFTPESERVREERARKKNHTHDLSCTVHHSLHKTIKMCVRFWYAWDLYEQKSINKGERDEYNNKNSQANHNAAEGKHA